MKTLLVYYSLEGNDKVIVDAISEETDCEVLELIPTKEVPKSGFFKFVWGGKQVVFNEKPELQPYKKDFSSYDLIIIGSPVWAGTYAPVFNTFFSDTVIKNKKIALFACYGGSEGKIFDSFKSKLEGNEIIGQIGFKNPAKNETAKSKENAKKWIRGIVE